MPAHITNIHNAHYQEGESQRDEPDWRYLDLSGQHLGARIEETPPGGTSSYHHYHTTEEEHVLVLAGHATLFLGDERVPLVEGDHLCFPAGEALAHHIENTSGSTFRFLVFGERKHDDVVFYPEGGILLLKSGDGRKQYTYRELKTER